MLVFLGSIIFTVGFSSYPIADLKENAEQLTLFGNIPLTQEQSSMLLSIKFVRLENGTILVENGNFLPVALKIIHGKPQHKIIKRSPHEDMRLLPFSTQRLSYRSIQDEPLSREEEYLCSDMEILNSQLKVYRSRTK